MTSTWDEWQRARTTPPSAESGSAPAERDRVAREAAERLSSARAMIDEAAALLASLTDHDAGQRAGEDDVAPLLEAVEIAEGLSAAASAAGTRAAVLFRASRIAQQRDAGLARKDLGRGIGDELALARRISPTRASNQLALGRVLVESMPRTFGLLTGGEISAWAADEVAKAVLVLDDADRTRVDEDLAAELPQVTARRAGVLARARADELDPHAALDRSRREIDERHVSIRPVTDTMVRLSALLPSVQGVAVYAALERHARAARASGVESGRGRAMADELVSRVTGLTRIEDANIEIQLLMTDATLLGDGNDVAWVEGRPLPGAIARHLALDSDSSDGASTAPAADPPGTAASRRWVRRLYTDPVTGTLREIDERRREFAPADRRFVMAAQQFCIVPWCDAEIRHLHHVDRYADGGATVRSNAVGVCERFNYTAEMPGWDTRRLDDASLRITTPTGRTYDTRPPPLRRPRRASDPGSTPTVATTPDHVVAPRREAPRRRTTPRRSKGPSRRPTEDHVP